MSQIKTDSPESLLRDFLGEGRSEKAFSRLVKATGGLVYGSALRRTGDASLAEEVAQTVFVILAQKAGSLRDHTSLSSWLYRTTSFEAEKALRKEIRHRRRIEKFAHDTMNDFSDDEISADTLKLLEQSIDHLSEKDRRLLLARFFEGKKFREIAAETRQSEAACKVRLRRILDKMGAWLNRRGCTLTVTALTGLLTSEWAKACPVTLSSSASLFLNGSTTSTTAALPTILTAMKISKMTAVGLVLLIAAAATPLFMNADDQKGPDEAGEPRVTISNASSIEGRSNSGRSIEGKFANYPYAYERLEELYQKYPNLRLPEFVPAEEKTIVDELNQFLEGIDNSEFKIPPEIQAQLRGDKDWDSEAVAGFLAGKEKLIEQLLRISKFSTGASRFRYLIHENTQEVFAAKAAGRLLDLLILNEIRGGNLERSKEVFDGMQRIHEAASKPFLVHALVNHAAHSRLQNGLSNLAQEGYDVRYFSDKLSRYSARESISHGLRVEAGAFISLLEAAKQIDDRAALMDFFGKTFVTGPSGEGESVVEQVLMRQEAMNLDVNDLQDDYARIFSGYLASLPDSESPETMVQSESGNLGLKISNYNLSRGRELILERIIPNMDQFAKKISEIEQSKRELTTWNALNQAHASGITAASLSELVPEFLPEVPVNPKNNEPFVFDAEARVLDSRD